MSLLSLNCRGLRNPRTVYELHNFVKREDPAVVFLMETRLEAKNMDWLRVRLAMKGAFAVDRHGTKGWFGVAMGK
jgi:exonuclease III